MYDTLMYTTIETTTNAQQLQSDLTKLELWSVKWQKTFNPTKYYVLRIVRKSNPIFYDYKLGNQVLELNSPKI